MSKAMAQPTEGGGRRSSPKIICNCQNFKIYQITNKITSTSKLNTITSKLLTSRQNDKKYIFIGKMKLSDTFDPYVLAMV